MTSRDGRPHAEKRRAREGCAGAVTINRIKHRLCEECHLENFQYKQLEVGSLGVATPLAANWAPDVSPRDMYKANHATGHRLNYVCAIRPYYTTPGIYEICPFYILKYLVQERMMRWLTASLPLNEQSPRPSSHKHYHTPGFKYKEAFPASKLPINRPFHRRIIRCFTNLACAWYIHDTHRHIHIRNMVKNTTPGI